MLGIEFRKLINFTSLHIIAHTYLPPFGVEMVEMELT
jgi:hypothetical protein